jgi:hypothetical protein
MLRIAVLLHDCQSLQHLLGVLPAGSPASDRADVYHVLSWDELDERAAGGLIDVAVVDPFLGFESNSNYPAVLARLHRLSRVLGCGRIVLYSQSLTRGSPDLKMISATGITHLVGVAEDDDSGTLLRMLARTAADAQLHRWQPRVEREVGPGAYRILIDAVRLWPPPLGVDDAARRLHSSVSGFRARMKRLGLPPPRRVLACLNLIEARALYALGVTFRVPLARILGYEEGSSLSRVARRLTGMPLREFLQAPEAENLVLGSLLDRRSA